MLKRAAGGIREDVATLYRLGRAGDCSAAQLLAKFAVRDGEATELAFAVLMERHSPMVLRACRRLLTDSPSGDDAVQATFMVLLTPAHSLRKSDSVGGWQYGVACRVSAHIRADEGRRRITRRAGPWWDGRLRSTRTH
jgi:HlyD family secretion protein